MKFKVKDIVRITRISDIWHKTDKVGIIYCNGGICDWWVEVDGDIYSYNEDELKREFPVEQQLEFDFMSS